MQGAVGVQLGFKSPGSVCAGGLQEPGVTSAICHPSLKGGGKQTVRE